MTADGGEFRKLIADDVRWHLLQELARSDRKVQELVASSRRPQNLVSYHLARLRRAGLVTQRRSSADARDTYYQLDLDRFTDLYLRAARGVQPAFFLAGLGIPLEERSGAGTVPVPLRRWRVLFVCTANSARSQMAEAFTRAFSHDTLRELSRGPVEAESAGTAPRPVHPMAIRVMKDLGVDIGDQRSTPLGQVRGHHFDQVITLCDVARESCGPIPGLADPVHWSLPDPAATVGSEEELYEAFRTSALAIAARVRQLLVQIGAERKKTAEHGDG